MMKSLQLGILMGIAVLFMVSSCATVPTEPLAPGEVRLLRIHFPEIRVIKGNFSYLVNLNFEADGKPEITRACFFWSGDGPYCYKVVDAQYGWGTLKVDLPIPSPPYGGFYTLKGYIVYMKDGRSQRTNIVETMVEVVK
jgi:hypothetical protein